MVAKLNPKIVSLSLAIVSIILSLLCAIFIAIMPQLSIRFFGSIFHGIDITQISVPITFFGIITGLIAIAIIAFVTGWLFSIVHNFLVEKIK